MRTYTIFLFLLAATSLLPAQTVELSPDQTARVANLSKLWGHLKYFHPYPAYRAIALDSAYAAAVPRLIAAATVPEQAAAVQSMLDVLGDPLTRVLPAATADDAGAAPLEISLTPENIVIVRTGDYAGMEDFVRIAETLKEWRAKLPSARGVLLDFRTSRRVPETVRGYWPYIFDDSKWASYLTSAALTVPAQRQRMHSGFAPETGGTSGGYYSAFYAIDPKIVTPAPEAHALPVALLVNAHTDLPAQALALGLAPGNRIFTVGARLDDLMANTGVFELTPELRVQMRISELDPAAAAVGSTSQYLAETSDWQQPEQQALDFLRHGPAKAPVAAEPANAQQVRPEPLKPGPPSFPPGTYPSLGYRLLAGAKIWTVIYYFFAYRELMPGDWDAALLEALPRLAAARDSLEYNFAIADFYRYLRDGHGSIRSAVLAAHLGNARAPLAVRFIEDQAVVAGCAVDSLCRSAGVVRGDIVLAIDGEPVADRVRRLSRLTRASNDWTERHYIANSMLRGPADGNMTLKLRTADRREKTVTLPLRRDYPRWTDRAATDTVQLLAGNIGYIDLGRIVATDVPAAFERLKATRAIIFDMRGYPNGTAWVIAPYLTDRKNVAGPRFRRYAPNEPDLGSGDVGKSTNTYSFVQNVPPNTGQPVYRGRTVMLIDERTQSQAEHTGLMFEAANGTEFIGSPTAGANGDITAFSIPGDVTLTFSGHDVRHADGRQLQQVGLQPKVPVRPTIEGLRAGRDEVLEAALEYLKKKPAGPNRLDDMVLPTRN
jgi:C-terminal processing protease CtpA/Prc